MADNHTIIVDGFAFSEEAAAKQAQKEKEGVAYIQGKMDMDHPQMVLEVYNKMVEQNLFETPIGEHYLKQLQNYLLSIPYLEREQILPIPVRQQPAAAAKARRKSAPKAGKPAPKRGKTAQKKNAVNWEGRAKALTVVCAALVVCVIAMFAIQMTVGSPTILDYENKIVDKYAQWEQELQEREDAIRAGEQQTDGSGQEE